MKRKHKTPVTSHKSRAAAGSALILTVVLTTLLAIIGVVFLLAARIDKIAASAASENREINFAIDTIIAEISQQLVLDVPRVPGQEYYDYPDVNNSWLASLEPYKSGNNYYWRQISDVFGKPGGQNRDVRAGVIDDYDIVPGLADADGDGAADSYWVVIPDVNSGRGKPIYAAIRIIDNDGMLNVNTAYQFNPNVTDSNLIDGSSQLQINLMALANKPGRPVTPPGVDEVALLAERADYRFGNNPLNLPQYVKDLTAYEPNVIWRYGNPSGAYTPFDVGDELELRYRFLVNHEDIRTRIERIWAWSFNCPTELNTPIRTGGSKTITDWFYRAQNDINEPNGVYVYSYRHIATTCNIDRIIDPNCSKMVNVNIADVNSLYNAIRKALPDTLAAQVAVNLFDFRDNDDYVKSLSGAGGQIYYGFERPCIYISELDYNQVTITTGSPPNTTTVTYKSCAVELYKPYSEDDVPRPPRRGAWRLVVGGSTIGIGSPSWLPGKSFYVVQKQDSNAPITVDPNAVVKNYQPLDLSGNPNIELWREVTEPNGTRKYIIVDSVRVPDWLVTGDGLRSYQRDISKHKCIRQLWDSASKTPTLGKINSYVDNSRPELIQARPANRPFTNIGEIGMLFIKSAYLQGPNPIRPREIESDARLNLANRAYQRLFNYLTVTDPVDHNNPSTETRIKGRININTAPWLVIAQLPWMQPQIAQAIVAYRDTSAKGFRSIGEMMNVAEMDYYAVAPGELGDLIRFPDLTRRDDAPDDFEERDVIFARISNLVTVRSDVFTAYILVRIGVDGPQKRVLAILDRSQVTPLTGKVKVIALQPVPDPR